MSRRSSDMSLLLFILILFSASIGFLHGIKTPSASLDSGASNEESEKLILDDSRDMIQALLDSNNMEEAGKMLVSPLMHDDLALNILENVRFSLTDEQKIRLLIAAISNQEQSEKRTKLIGYLLLFFPNSPIFAYDLHQPTAFIPAIASWAQAEGKPHVLNNWKNRSIAYAIELNDEPLLSRLYASGIRPAQEKVSHLLYKVVEDNKDVAFVPFLVQRLEADPNYSPDKKMTVLMQATKNNNKQMVKALLEVNADPDIVLDPQVGSAIQIALENGFVEIEQLLRQN